MYEGSWMVSFQLVKLCYGKKITDFFTAQEWKPFLFQQVATNVELVAILETNSSLYVSFCSSSSQISLTASTTSVHLQWVFLQVLL